METNFQHTNKHKKTCEKFWCIYVSLILYCYRVWSCVRNHNLALPMFYQSFSSKFCRANYIEIRSPGSCDSTKSLMELEYLKFLHQSKSVSVSRNYFQRVLKQPRCAGYSIGNFSNIWSGKIFNYFQIPTDFPLKIFNPMIDRKSEGTSSTK